MTKYMVALIIIILGGLLFINKDKLFTNSDSNLALVTNITNEGMKPDKRLACEGYPGNCKRTCESDLSSCQCTSPDKSGKIKCYVNEVYATTTKTHTLKTQRLVADKNGVYKGSGSITPTTGKYNSGTTAVLQATPAKDSKVIWSAEGCGKNNTCKIRMDQDKTIAYAFVPKGNLLRDVFKNCMIIPFYDPSTKTYRFEMNCSW